MQGGKLFDILGKISQHLEIFPTRVIAAYNFVVGIVVFGVLRCAGRLRKDKVENWILRLNSVFNIGKRLYYRQQS